jgi:hypothetical protein
MSIGAMNPPTSTAVSLSMKRPISLKRMRPTSISPEPSIVASNIPSGTVTSSSSEPPRKIVRIISALPARLGKKINACNPQKSLESILDSKGIKSKVHSFDSLPGFFEETKQEEINCYGFDVLNAVRESDIDTLRAFHREGRPLKCSNRFGESLLHLACRKGIVKVVDFLVNEVEVPLQVKDDMGRSPLHDAFWTCEPSFELIDIILKKCPDLLLISDKRGHTPLSYARQNDWAMWNDYLEDRTDMVTPMVLV